MSCTILITDGYKYFVFDKINVIRINWFLVEIEIMPFLQDNWSEKYNEVNGNIEQLKKLNAQSQWMVIDGWSDPEWKCASNIN